MTDTMEEMIAQRRRERALRERRNRLCTAFAFYDFEPEQVDLKGLFVYMEQWFLDHNQIPGRAACGGEGINARTTKTFKHIKKKLFERGFQGITHFWFASHPPQYTSDSFDALLSVGISFRDNGAFNFYFHHDVMAFDKDAMTRWVKDICAYVGGRYGIVYHIAWDRAPPLYTIGFDTNYKSDLSVQERKLEDDRVAKWGIYYMQKDHKELGKLRDIYPMSVLSQVHLDQPVLGTTLGQWITASPDRGDLSKLTDNLWQWWVSEDAISPIREALRPTDVILCP